MVIVPGMARLGMAFTMSMIRRFMGSVFITMAATMSTRLVILGPAEWLTVVIRHRRVGVAQPRKESRSRPRIEVTKEGIIPVA